LKLVTWNVNGLRAVLGKGALDWTQSSAPDVLCLQEIKVKPEQLDAQQHAQLGAVFPHITWRPADRPGYSGVATLGRTPPLEVRLGLGLEKFDSEGRLICWRFPNFLLFNLYFPNGQHNLSRLPYKLEFYARLLDLCDDLHAQGEQIILTGDFNTCHHPIDLRNPRQNEGNTGFLPEERAWVDLYLAHGFVDIYRQLYPESVQYTWWTYRMNARARNVGWRLDYFLISAGLVERVQDAAIHEDILGSDHCPVSLTLADW
jgi:exodeoxyribonuclease-3